MQKIQLISIFTSVLFLTHYELKAIPVYQNGFQNPVSIGMGALGVGLSHPVSGMYNNPGYLNQQGISLVDLGINSSIYGGNYSPINPGGFGGYYKFSDSKWAIYGVYSSMYSKYLPDRENVNLNTAHLGLSYQFQENLVLSMGVGPSLVHRFRSLSKWSFSGKANLLYTLGDVSIGGMVEIPGRFSREDYRGGEELLETAPERVSFGMEYRIFPNMGVYAEARKIFWERSEFLLNGIDETPDWERGIGAEWSFSGSFYWRNIGDSKWEIRSGLEYGGAYDSSGKNLRSVGLAGGFGYNWKWDEESEKEKNLSIQFGLLDYSITSTKNNRSPETIYSFSLSYLSY
ncbi:MAG: hypothetical protein JJT78_15920 [Leptospira sp.]|nr:hypothetical protein [Leptospira sp.]